MQPDRERDLDRELRDLGPRAEYPPVPDLARSVRSRLETEAGGSESPARSGPQLWWIAAAALVLLIAIPVFSLAIRGMGGAMSAGGGSAGEGGQAGGGSGRQGGADTAESTQPPSLAMESGSTASATSESSDSACAYPASTLRARPARGAPGDGFRLNGRYFDGDLRDCDDDPARDVRIEFLQDGKTWALGRFVSDENSRLAAQLRVPADARPGRATVRATYGQGPPGDPYGQTTTEARFFVPK